MEVIRGSKMKLAVSNIAWDVANDYSVAKVLRELEIGYI